MKARNSTLEKQLKRYFFSKHQGEVPPHLHALFDVISDAYDHYEKDKQILERASLLASEELEEANASLVELNENLDQRVKERTEELRSALDQARRSNEAKSLFLAKMSHELRTPLNAVIGFSEILSRSMKQKEMPGKLQRFVENIRTTGKQLSHIIGDILDLSMIQSGKQSLHYTPTSISSLTKDVWNHHIEKAKKKQVSLLLDVDQALPKEIMADGSKLQQVVSNLVDNALKFTEGRGRVTIQAEQSSSDTLTISVEDTGIGIPQSALEHIFKPFEQTDNSISRNFGGTGLGLAIAHEIITSMQGRIGVESKEGKGSRFYIILPIKMPVCSSQKLLTVKGSMFTETNRVLIVEDNTTNQEMITQFLELHNITQVTIAGNGHEALDALKNEVPDLVLLDLHMPLMDGFETAKHIRESQDPQTASVPIAAFTADASSATRTAVLEASINDYLTKPIDFDEMVKVLEKHLEKEAMDSELTSSHS